MPIKNILIAAFALFCFQGVTLAQENDEIFTIYLVRHAEKAISKEHPRNPPLTECGQKRAESLATFLEQVQLDAVYSTNYTRTLDTAEPTAKAQELEVKVYNPQVLSEFAQELIDRKQDALVVGHSNTTGVLAGLLVGEQIGSFPEDIYNRIYQVVIHKKAGRLHVLHTAFTCEK